MTRALALLTLATTLASCSGLRSIPADSPRLRRIERVALVAFDASVGPEIVSQIPDSLFGAAELRQMVMTAVNHQESARGEGLYGVFAGVLEAESGWTVVPRQALVSDPAFARIAEKWRGASFGALQTDGILTAPIARMLEVEERRELAKSLGVDALLVVELRFFPEQVSPPQITGERLWARVIWSLLDAEPEPVLTDETDATFTKNGLPPLATPQSLVELGRVVRESTELAASALPFGKLARERKALEEKGEVKARRAADAPSVETPASDGGREASTAETEPPGTAADTTASGNTSE